MTEKRIQIKDIVSNQLPQYVKEDYPLVAEFLKQYYLSQEFPGGPADLIQNIDRYVKVDSTTELTDFVLLQSDISSIEENISVDFLNFEQNQIDFPNNYGLISIDDELILYENKTQTGFENCHRGFSGIISHKNVNVGIASTYRLRPSDELIFKKSDSSSHKSGAKIYNLSSLFLKEFLLKLKYQLTPGFENRSFVERANEATIIKQIKDFYRSKGTDQSFEILFRSLYGEDVEVLRPKNFLFRPSDAQYKITNDFIVEKISGPIEKIRNLTLFQNEYLNITKAYGTVTEPLEEIVTSDGKIFYKLKIDGGYNRDLIYDGAIYGGFSVHPKTRVIGNYTLQSTTIDVDSTVGFPNKGEFLVNYEDGTQGVVSYNSKSLTQFIECSGIAKNILDKSIIGVNTYAYANTEDGEEIRVRIVSTLNDLEIPNDNILFSEGDTIRIKTLGFEDGDARLNEWLFNLPIVYDVESYSIIDDFDNTYSLTLKDNHNLKVGDILQIIDNLGNRKQSTIIDVTSDKTIVISGQGFLPQSLYTVKRNILKGNSSKYSYIGETSTDIQNVYTNKNNDILISSPSIPYYPNAQLNLNNRTVSFSGSYSAGSTIFKLTSTIDHGFYTGDCVYYTPEKETIQSRDIDGNINNFEIISTSLFDEGIYFIKRIDKNNIKLSKSKSDILYEKYVSPENDVVINNNKIEPIEFSGKAIKSQKLLREISTPIISEKLEETSPGFTGILINGTEILNYKSKDKIIFGPLEKIDVISGGSDYDIINPPTLIISDSVGSGATGHCSVSGSLREIRILDPGFDYLEDPIVQITGGNGIGAVAKCNTKLITHKSTFNSEKGSGLVGIGSTISTIGFSTYHKFRNGEEVIYKTNSHMAVGGLSTDSKYYVSTVSTTKIKLHKTLGDSISGINTITLTNHGIGNHDFESVNQKRILSSISIENSGSGYQNKKRTVSYSGINIASDIITIENHGFLSGEIVKYTTTGTVIGGLVQDKNYYILKIDDNQFKLCEVGTGNYAQDYFYNTRQFVNLTSRNSDTHVFNYPDIEVKIIGNVGLSSNYKAQIDPIFRGEITSFHLESKGSSYGVEEVFNIERQPSLSILSGSGAEFDVIVSGGRIQKILINSVGQNYTCSPDLIVVGDGNGAVLTPVVLNNQIVDVKIIEPGAGYSSNNTRIIVSHPGSGVEFTSKIKTWTVNLFAKYLNIFTEDDGCLSPGLNEQYEIEYCHLYAPRKLRQILYSRDQSGKILFSNPDLKFSRNKEIKSIDHSPIIGWSYDGHPIYGPYGYSKKSGGVVSQIKSGYNLIIDQTRPSTKYFQPGFFVEDFKYQKSNDESVLDENNGRFCITPEFPNGTYAYFATFDESSVDSSGPFKGYYRPKFPYLIGNFFNSKPNDFNFKKKSNQDDIDLNKTDWIRNTYAYNITKTNSRYEYITLPNDLNQSIDVSGVSPGSVDSIGISTGGDNYKVNDKLIFNNIDSEGNSRTLGSPVSAVVSELIGKSISTVSTASTYFYDVPIYPSSKKGEYVLYNNSPHNIDTYDLVKISGLNTTSNIINGNYIAGVAPNRLVLVGLGTTTVGIATANVTGIVTYISVRGNLNFPSIRENDIYQIDSEKVKILNVDKKSSRLRILRQIEGTPGLSHSVTTLLYEDPRKLFVKVSKENDITNYSSYLENKQIYFDPKESLGIGTNSNVGIGTTIYFSNPGVGATQVFIPLRTIYLPEHGLNTGDLLTYEVNDGSPIVVSSTGIGTTSLSNNSSLYVAKINENLIGISTVQVGLGSTGFFSGITTSTQNIGLLFFAGIGTGTYHSFKTNYPEIKGDLSKHVVTVSTAQTHGLTTDDVVNVMVGASSTTVIVKYNESNRRIIVNPRDFTGANISTSNSTITILNHGYVNGQRVIYTSNSPSGGLVNNQMYYVVAINKDIIKLSNSQYDSTIERPNTINITSASSGTISPINPPIDLYKNSTVTFDLSDSSLSYVNASKTYPSFKFELYVDGQFRKVFDSDQRDNSFNVQRAGVVGTSGAVLTLKIDDFIPNTLYYDLVPLDSNGLFLPEAQREIIKDVLVNSHNQLRIRNSVYNGTYKIRVSDPNYFEYFLPTTPEVQSYTSGISTTSTLSLYLKYTTESLTASGAISKIKITNKGTNYYSLPGITSVSSLNGRGCILNAESNTIGKIKKIKIVDGGFDFTSDKTLRPYAEFPENIKIDNLFSIDNIGISSQGRGYTSAPKLLVLDGKTKKVIPSNLSYKLGDNKVTIKINAKGLTDSIPTIIPTQNSNGIGITDITYNPTTKEAKVYLPFSFSDIGNFDANTYPIRVGDKVLIENISVGVNSTSKGFNSSNYEYSLFTITSIDLNIGGVSAVTYSLDEYLSDSESPGTYDPVNSSGRIVPERNFPIFVPTIKQDEYKKGETVRSNGSLGVVENWDPITKYLKISSKSDFKIGSIIEGLSSKTIGTASSIVDFNSYAKTDFSIKVLGGWESNAGFLNDNAQRIQDSLYYQNFSYSLKSRVDYDTWNDAVSALNHTVGFKKYSDFQMESKLDNDVSNLFVGLSTDTTATDVKVELISYGDLNCVTDFDLGRENYLNLNSKIASNKIYFDNVPLTDYYEARGNRVLLIDDISPNFNSGERPERYSDIYKFNINTTRSLKFLSYIRDKQFTGQRQVMLTSLIHNDSYGVINQYGRIETAYDLGSFDFIVDQPFGIVRFYPTRYTINNYDVALLSYNLDDAFTGVGTTTIGSIVKVDTSNISSTASAINVVSLATSYTSAKILVQIYRDSLNYQFNELNVVHKGTNASIDFIEYGELSTKTRTVESSGYGTYYPYISGGNLKIDFIPNVSVGNTFYINTANVALGDTNSSGIGTIELEYGEIRANSVSIPSSPTPTASTILSFTGEHDCAYCLVQVSDITNNRCSFSEVILIVDDVTSEPLITEYGNVQTFAGLGTIGASVTGIGSTTQLVFTPLPNIQVQVKVYANLLGLEGNDIKSYQLSNLNVSSQYGSYSGTEVDQVRTFNLTHKGYPLFERYFSASDSSIVDLSRNTIKIPSHFYSTGEKITYDANFGNPIGIATTTIAGIGSTTILPSTLYVVNLNNNKIRVAASASEALRPIPNVLNLTSLGSGAQHKFLSQNKNSRVVVAIDNIIQSPIVSTGLTASLTSPVFLTDESIELDNSTSFYGGDLIKINDEVMRITSIQKNNVVNVRRSWMGTDIANHSGGSLVNTVVGSYNIVNNNISFAEAPYGNVPQTYTTSPPDEQDWVGISTGSSFSGRCFMRSGIQDSLNDTYSKNYIFDDIATGFNGITSTFTLKSSQSDITGISEEGALILINDIVQARGLSGDLENERKGINFTLSESSGITSATFIGSATSVSYDINSSGLPKGGIIVSVGSTEGLGYQPLVSAGGTAIVSLAGTIQSISIGNTGSGYRASAYYDIPTNISSVVGVGSTEIFIENKNSVFGLLNLLNTGSNCSIGVGTFIFSTNIVSVGSSFVRIGFGSTSSNQISVGTPVNIKISNPQVGIVNVGISSTSTENSAETYVGFATIIKGKISESVTITKVASGYTSSNPPQVIIDDPLSYSDVPLIYSSSSISGVGTAATIDIVVGQGSSVIDFEIKNTGYNYRAGQTLTVPIGGLTGIPTTSSFKEFQISIQEVFNDKFTGWAFGELQILDDISDLFDGERVAFPLKYFGELISIRSARGSNINPQELLLVFINDVLQEPGKGYTFRGGSNIFFTEPPKPPVLEIPNTGDSCKILFYKGTASVDVVYKNIIETVKPGDGLTLGFDSTLNQSYGLQEDERIVDAILSSDLASTNPYYGPGNTKDETLTRPITWCRQTEDKIIDEQEVSKDRMLYEPVINPSAYLIKSVGIGSTIVFVDNLKPIFNPVNENKSLIPSFQDEFLSFQKQITFIPQETKRNAFATAIVSVAGTISSIAISTGGFGYLSVPDVVIQNPIGFGTTCRAEATVSISSGIVTSITITGPGTEYSQENPPVVLISPPSFESETNTVIQYEGDFGIISGISTTSVGVASTGIVFDFAIEKDSILRVVGIASTSITGVTTISGIQTGYYFAVYNSRVGNGVTSLDENRQVIGIGTTGLDNIYRVASVSLAQTAVPGLGVTYVARVTVSVSGYNGLSGIGYSSLFAEYSWGKITLKTRTKDNEYNSYTRSGFSGISTGTIIMRTNPLKYYNYGI